MEYQYTNRLIHLFYDDAIEAPFNYPSLLSSAYSCAAKLVYLIDAAKKGNDIPSFARDKRQMHDKITVYICRNFTCSKPLTEWKDIERLLSQAV